MNSAIGMTVIIIIGVLGIYYWLVYRYGLLNPKVVGNKAENTPFDSSGIIPRHITANKTNKAMTLPATADFIAIETQEEIDDSRLEMLPAEDMTLLKEAESVVDKIQDCINHIASDPPNRDEISSKLKAIIQPYSFFQETEYYDSINTYITLSIERDCGIKLTPQDVQAWWD